MKCESRNRERRDKQMKNLLVFMVSLFLAFGVYPYESPNANIGTDTTNATMECNGALSALLETPFGSGIFTVAGRAFTFLTEASGAGGLAVVWRTVDTSGTTSGTTLGKGRKRGQNK
jgi:hypothetical protein